MKIVVIESPYAGDLTRNLKYARLAVRDSILRGEAPFASHLLYTQDHILKDDDPGERLLGIKVGFTFKRVADLTAFYLDNGWSSGMKMALEFCKQNQLKFETRYLENWR